MGGGMSHVLYRGYEPESQKATTRFVSSIEDDFLHTRLQGLEQGGLTDEGNQRLHTLCQQVWTRPRFAPSSKGILDRVVDTFQSWMDSVVSTLANRQNEVDTSNVHTVETIRALIATRTPTHLNDAKITPELLSDCYITISDFINAGWTPELLLALGWNKSGYAKLRFEHPHHASWFYIFDE